jgi:hypothetical protein
MNQSFGLSLDAPAFPKLRAPTRLEWLSYTLRPLRLPLGRDTCGAESAGGVAGATATVGTAAALGASAGVAGFTAGAGALTFAGAGGVAGTCFFAD